MARTNFKLVSISRLILTTGGKSWKVKHLWLVLHRSSSYFSTLVDNHFKISLIFLKKMFTTFHPKFLPKIIYSLRSCHLKSETLLFCFQPQWNSVSDLLFSFLWFVRNVLGTQFSLMCSFGPPQNYSSKASKSHCFLAKAPKCFTLPSHRSTVAKSRISSLQSYLGRFF